MDGCTFGSNNKQHFHNSNHFSMLNASVESNFAQMQLKVQRHKSRIKNYKIVPQSKGYGSNLTGCPDIMHFVFLDMVLIGLSLEPKCSIKLNLQVKFSTGNSQNQASKGGWSSSMSSIQVNSLSTLKERSAAGQSEEMFMNLSQLCNLPVVNFNISIFRAWLLPSLS